MSQWLTKKLISDKRVVDIYTNVYLKWQLTARINMRTDCILIIFNQSSQQGIGAF